MSNEIIDFCDDEGFYRIFDYTCIKLLIKMVDTAS